MLRLGHLFNNLKCSDSLTIHVKDTTGLIFSQTPCSLSLQHLKLRPSCPTTASTIHYDTFYQHYSKEIKCSMVFCWLSCLRDLRVVRIRWPWKFKNKQLLHAMNVYRRSPGAPLYTLPLSRLFLHDGAGPKCKYAAVQAKRQQGMGEGGGS
jgi:hypothetical protein